MSSLGAQVNTSKEELEGLKSFTNKLIDQLASEFEGVQEKFQEFKSSLAGFYEEQNKKNSEMNQKYLKSGERIKKLKQGIDEFAVF